MGSGNGAMGRTGIGAHRIPLPDCRGTMSQRIKLIAGGLGVLAAGAGAAVWLGSVRWSRTTSSQVQMLIETAAWQHGRGK